MVDFYNTSSLTERATGRVRIQLGSRLEKNQNLDKKSATLRVVAGFSFEKNHCQFSFKILLQILKNLLEENTHKK